VRLAAFSALQSHSRSVAILEAFRRGLQDENYDIRRLAFSKLVEFEGATDEMLRQLISAISDPKLQDTARRLLISIGEPAIPPLLEAIKRDETKSVAAELLSHIPPGEHRTKVIANMIALLKDENREVRIVAIRALERIGKSTSGFGDVGSQYLRYFEKVLNKYDDNEDGVLTREEWSKMARDPALADQDKDGHITLEEYVRWVMQGR
jgi:HEAT repeat protein